MLSKFSKAILITTSSSPIFLSLAAVKVRQPDHRIEALLLTGLACLLGCVALWMIDRAPKALQASRIEIKKAKSADKEILAFFVAYASPLFLSKILDISYIDLLIYGAAIIVVLLGTNSLNVNPVLGIFGYNYYEVDSEGGITYLLISKRKIYDIKDVQFVIQLTEYAVLDKGD